MGEQEKLQILKNQFGAWEHLTEAEQEALVKNSYVVTCKKDETVHNGETNARG